MSESEEDNDLIIDIFPWDSTFIYPFGCYQDQDQDMYEEPPRPLALPSPPPWNLTLCSDELSDEHIYNRILRPWPQVCLSVNDPLADQEGLEVRVDLISISSYSQSQVIRNGLDGPRLMMPISSTERAEFRKLKITTTCNSRNVAHFALQFTLCRDKKPIEPEVSVCTKNLSVYSHSNMTRKKRRACPTCGRGL